MRHTLYLSILVLSLVTACTKEADMNIAKESEHTVKMCIRDRDLSSYDLCNAAEKLEVEQAFGMFNDPGADFESQRMMIKMYNQRQSAVKSGINTDWISKPLRLGVGNKHSPVSYTHLYR